MSTEEDYSPELDGNRNRVPAIRKRQRKHALSPINSEKKVEFIQRLAASLTPSFDYFLFSLISAVLIAVALHFDTNPVLYILAVISIPFLAPHIAIGITPAVGLLTYFTRTFGAALLGSAMVFAVTYLAGFLEQNFTGTELTFAPLFTQMTPLNFLILSLGILWVMISLVKMPAEKPLAAGMLIGLALYLPIGISGFGLGYERMDLFTSGMIAYWVNFGWISFLGMLVLLFYGVIAHSRFGILLAVIQLFIFLSIVLGAGLISLGDFSTTLTVTATPEDTPAPVVLTEVTPSAMPISTTAAPTAGMTSTRLPTQTATRAAHTPTPTNTLIPSQTPTVTFTPKPTQFFAAILVKGSNGAVIREGPSYDSPIVKSLLNGVLVEILPGAENRTADDWVKVRTNEMVEGWILLSLLDTE